jgi:hypothetical protein
LLKFGVSIGPPKVEVVLKPTMGSSASRVDASFSVQTLYPQKQKLHSHTREQLMKILPALIVLMGIALASSGPRSLAQDSLPKADPSFAGKVDIDVRKSTPSWPQGATAQKGAPNILLIVVDDDGG